MADEDITLDGKPLQSLRVADLKAALEQRNLSKSGQKNALMKRLKGALMLENLQRSSSSHSGLQPNSQIGEEMSQNSFIQQYLAKQQELLRQRLEREAQQNEEADDSPAVPEEDEDLSEDNDSSPYVSDKRRSIHSQPSMSKVEDEGGDIVMADGTGECGPNVDAGRTLHPQESLKAPGIRLQRATFHQGLKEPPAPSPPRAVASLSVRVLDQPDRQGLPPAIPQAQEKEGTAPSEPGSAHPVLHLSRSARVFAGGHVHEEDDEDDSDDEESEDDDDWGPGPGAARMGNKASHQPQQMPPSVPSTFARSKRKRQPPQHIPPPQVHHNPLQLRHPTPPPSPPPDLFPLPDTPKQSPPDTNDQERQGPRGGAFPPPTMQRQDSDSSSRSSSPEPLLKCRPGPLSLLIHKMESEDTFSAGEATSAAGMSGEAAHAAPRPAGSSKSTEQKLETKSPRETRDREEERRLKEEKERKQREVQGQEREKQRLEEEEEKKRKQQKQEEKLCQKEEQEEEREHQEKGERREERAQEQKYKTEEAASKDHDSDSSSDSDSKSSSSSRSSQSSSSSARDKTGVAGQQKISDRSSEYRSNEGQEVEDEKKTDLTKGAEKRCLSKREVSEPNTAAVTEVEPDSESSVAQQPPSEPDPENSECRLEEVPMPLPLPLTVPAAYYFYRHQHLLHSYSSYNSRHAMPKCVAGT